MPETPYIYDYAILRVVPRVDRGEFINAGVIVSCKSADYLKAKVELDDIRLAALDPRADPHDVRASLDSVPRICEGGRAAGPLQNMSARERFDWLVAPRSSSLQVSPVHTGRCDDLDKTLEKLFARLVRVTI